MPLAAGMLNRRITIQARNATEDAATGAEMPAATPTAIVSLWTKVDTLRAGEAFIVGMEQRLATNTLKFTVRYSDVISSLDPALHQILYRGKVYDLEAIVPLGGSNRPEGLVLTATAKDI